MTSKEDSALFAVAQSLRESHCDRKGQDHQCVGEMTVKRGIVCLNCPLCGSGEQIPNWNSEHAKACERIFHEAGVEWQCLDFEAQRKAVAEYGLQSKRLT